MADHGIEVFTFQRTMSFGNWPFLVLILLLAGAASTSLIIDGDWKGVGLVFGAVCAVPLFVGAVQFLPELVGARVLVGVFAHGIVWARLGNIEVHIVERFGSPRLLHLHSFHRLASPARVAFHSHTDFRK